MECQARHSWTLTALVGAFLDLAIAYLLLCGSTVAYFASKFLGFFGLDLPCPCNGLFGVPSNGYCLRRFLIDCPTEKISNVQSAVKSAFPFDSVWATGQYSGGMNAGAHNEKHYSGGHVELEGEASSSLISDARKMQGEMEQESLPKNELAEFGVMNSPASEDGKFDIKGKKAANQRSRSGLRRRRKSTLDYAKLSSIGSYDPMPAIALNFSMSSSSTNKETTVESSMPNNFSQKDGLNAVEVVPVDIGLHESLPYGIKLDEVTNERNIQNMNAPFVEELKESVEGGFGGYDRHENQVRFLEQALEEEHAVSASLYLELDKERSAAASAADEAMAMILRLQEEKASIEMEARQYKRMTEEKYAYDVEEMNILKEILMRREREKHFLEKEVEAYRQMITENEQSDGDISDSIHQQGGQGASYLSEDPLLILRQISDSIDSNEKVQDASSFPEYEVRCVDLQSSSLSHGKEQSIGIKDKGVDFLKQVDIQKDSNFDEVFQEKSVVSTVDNPLAQQTEAQTHAGLGFEEYATPVTKIEQSERSTLSQAFAGEMNKNHTYTERDLIINDYDLDRRSGDPRSSNDDTKPHVLDVHVIDDESCHTNDTSKRVSIDASGDSDAVIRNKLRSSSGVPPIGASKGKTLLSDMRRNSMSAVDYERLKIDTEVEWLRERLRTVQESRDKLNLCAEHTERETTQLQLLEDIASQLREIRRFTESGRRTTRQASLPLLLPSKVLSKKRRYRSVPLGVQHNT